jgi:hypothetical protein
LSNFLSCFQLHLSLWELSCPLAKINIYKKKKHPSPHWPNSQRNVPAPLVQSIILFRNDNQITP